MVSSVDIRNFGRRERMLEHVDEDKRLFFPSFSLFGRKDLSLKNVAFGRLLRNLRHYYWGKPENSFEYGSPKPLPQSLRRKYYNLQNSCARKKVITKI